VLDFADISGPGAADVDTTSLALGSVFLVIGVLIFGWPWIRRMGKSPTALIRGRP
jgi:phosphate/sulfate permease